MPATLLFCSLSDWRAKQAGVFQATIEIPLRQPTLYQRFGNWVGVLGALGIVIYVPKNN